MAEKTIEELAQELEATKGALSRAQKDLEESRARVTGFETALAGKEAELTALHTDHEMVVTKAEGLTAALTAAAQAYRSLVVKANPHIPEELIIGETVEAIQAGVQAAGLLVEKIRKNLEAQKKGAPAGSPQRTGPDLSGLTAAEKIKYAVNKGK
jgi:septation ring formation regulator EzrA